MIVPKMNDSPTTPRWPGRRTEAAALLLILLVAAAFRLYQLDSIPPGFTHDEAGHGHDAVAILQGARPIYETVGYGREPLYDYVVAWLMPIFGRNFLALRLTSVLAGLLLIVVAHFWIRRAFDVPIALTTSAFLAVSFWAISTSREALRSALLPALFTIVIYFMWQALRPYKRQLLPGLSPVAARWGNYALAGLFIGLAFYTYMAARVLPGVFVLLWLYLLIFHRSLWKENWLGIIVMVALGVAIAWPMFSYLLANPGTEQRLTQLSGPIDRLLAGDPGDLFRNALSALGMFSFGGDTLWLYNVPGEPILNWVLSIVFYIGLFVAIRRFRKIEYALAIFWLLIGIVPSLLTGVVASNLRSIAAQPMVYLFVAIGLVESVRFFDRVVDSHTLRSIPLVLLAILVTVFTYHDYFDAWGQAHDVRVAYNATLREVAGYLDRNRQIQADVAVSSIYPNRFHDPYSMDMLLQRKDLTLRWFTGSFVDVSSHSHASLVFPQTVLSAGCSAVTQTVQCASGVTNTTSVFTNSLSPAAPVAVATPPQPEIAPPNYSATVVVEAIAPIDPAFAELFDRHAEKIDSIELRPDDFNRRFDVYRFDATAALSDALKSSIVPTRPLDFDHAFALIGYEVRTPRVKPGATAEVITYWRINALVDRDLVLFTHALSGDANRPVLAQQDSLDVPSYYWSLGDAFAQVHRFVIPADAKPGIYPLEIGAYARDDPQKRLPIYDQSGKAIGDHVLIGPITGTSP